MPTAHGLKHTRCEPDLLKQARQKKRARQSQARLFESIIL
jgi:hypothetical protein